MPELPEVEALTRFLHARAVGHAVDRVEVGAIHVLKTYDPPPTALGGLLLRDVRRRGKFLDLDLTEAGTKKGLAVSVVRSPDEVPGVARLGVDVLDPSFTPEVLGGLLTTAGRTRLKNVLTDQSVLAGVGNAYSDEVLWEARLSPFTPASSLPEDAVEALRATIVETLLGALDRASGLGAASLKAEKKAGLHVHGRTGQPCPRCGDTIREIAYAEKSWQYCPACQTGGKPLADRRMSRLLK